MEKIANLLSAKKIKVFYDKFNEAKLLGKKLSTYFQNTYGSKSRYVIIFISKEYQIKDWTNFELKIAREEAKIRKSEFIIPIRLDDTPIIGIHDDVGYIDYRVKKLEGTVNLLIEKLKLNSSSFDDLKEFVFNEFNNAKVQFKNNLYLVLKKLQESPEITVKELSKKLNMPKSTLYWRIKKLREKGAIELAGNKNGTVGRPSKVLKFKQTELKT